MTVQTESRRRSAAAVRPTTPVDRGARTVEGVRRRRPTEVPDAALYGLTRFARSSDQTGCIGRRARRQLRRGARRGLRRHGPVRLGQVHPGALPDPADRADRGRGRVRGRGHPRRRREGGCASCAGASSPWCSSTSACCRTAGSSTTSRFGLEIRGIEQGRALRAAPPEVIELVGSGRLRELLSRPALRRHAAARRAWPARWPAIRTCCSSTSRSPRSTR